MANKKSAAKRARQTEKRTFENRRVTSAIKTQIKKLRADIVAGNKEESKAGLSSTSSTLDKAVKTGRIHRNRANRQKSRLGRAVASLA
jgi:small subunit ribosomal protein S20